MKMERAHVCEEVDATIDTVWKVIRDFADVSAWASGRVVHVEGAGVGMVRHIEGPGGRFVERCESHDDAAHIFSYRLLESPVPVTNYVGTVRLTAVGARRCAIDWSAQFEPKDPASATALRTAIENVFRGGFIVRLRDRLTRS
jgi:hypothetical protein